MVEYTPIGLTSRQRDALAFINNFQKSKGYAPSFQDIADGLGLKSKSGPHRLVEGLIKRGAAVRVPNLARSISVTSRGRASL